MRLRSILTAACLVGIIPLSVAAQDLSGTLKKIKDSGVITLGVRESSIPFSYMDDEQNYQGYSIEICKRITQRIQETLGGDELDVRMLPVTSATRIPLMVNGTIDITCGSDANTLERQKQVAFSYTTYVGHASFVSKKDSGITSIEDLKGKVVASTSGTTDVQLLADLNDEKDLGMSITVGPDHINAFMMMDTGRASAFAMTDILVASLIANARNPDDYSMYLIDALPVEPWSLMLRRDDPQFKELVDGVLGDLFETGEINQLYNTWFESELPSLGINLNIPMSARLEHAIANPTDSGNPDDYTY